MIKTKKNTFIKKTLVGLRQIHFSLLDHLVTRNPSFTRSDLMRAAIEEYVANHPDWDPDAFTAEAKQQAKELPEDAEADFWESHRRIMGKSKRYAVLPHAATLDIEVCAEDFDA